MASTFAWSEFNGSGATTETTARTDGNWKRVDDSTTSYNTSPINVTNNENSMSKYQAVKFAGSWNTLGALTFRIDNNAPATGLAIAGAVVTAGATPTTTATGDGPMSTTGASANFVSSSTPYGAGTASTSAGGTMFSQALRTQLQTTNAYAGGPGDTSQRTLTATWTES